MDKSSEQTRYSNSLAAEIALRLAVPLAIGGFIGLFAWSSSHLSFMVAGYPRFLMLLIIPILGLVMIREVLSALSAHRSQPVEPKPPSGSPMPTEPTHGRETSSGLSTIDRFRPAILAALLVAYGIALTLIGILPATAAFVALSLLALGYRSVTGIAIITACTIIAVWLLFIRIFRIPLPGVW